MDISDEHTTGIGADGGKPALLPVPPPPKPKPKLTLPYIDGRIDSLQEDLLETKEAGLRKESAIEELRAAVSQLTTVFSSAKEESAARFEQMQNASDLKFERIEMLLLQRLEDECKSPSFNYAGSSSRLPTSVPILGTPDLNLKSVNPYPVHTLSVDRILMGMRIDERPSDEPDTYVHAVIGGKVVQISVVNSHAPRQIFPEVDLSYPYTWLHHCEKYFKSNGITPDQYFSVIEKHMPLEMKFWYTYWLSNKTQITWKLFKLAFCDRFTSRRARKPVKALAEKLSAAAPDRSEMGAASEKSPIAEIVVEMAQENEVIIEHLGQIQQNNVAIISNAVGKDVLEGEGNERETMLEIVEELSKGAPEVIELRTMAENAQAINLYVTTDVGYEKEKRETDVLHVNEVAEEDTTSCNEEDTPVMAKTVVENVGLSFQNEQVYADEHTRPENVQKEVNEQLVKMQPTLVENVKENVRMKMSEFELISKLGNEVQNAENEIKKAEIVHLLVQGNLTIAAVDEAVLEMGETIEELVSKVLQKGLIKPEEQNHVESNSKPFDRGKGEVNSSELDRDVLVATDMDEQPLQLALNKEVMVSNAVEEEVLEGEEIGTEIGLKVTKVLNNNISEVEISCNEEMVEESFDCAINSEDLMVFEFAVVGMKMQYMKILLGEFVVKEQHHEYLENQVQKPGISFSTVNEAQVHVPFDRGKMFT